MMAHGAEQTTSKPSQTRSREDSVPRGKSLRRELANISGKVKESESVVSSLPYVSADGSSECGWAQSLYARKEELETEVRGKISLLANYLMWFDAEMLRCLENLKKIQADYARLNNQEPQDCYARAIRDEQDRCRSLQDDRDAVSIVLTKAKAVVAMSEKRKFPGKEPQQQYSIPTGMPGAVVGGLQGSPPGPSAGGAGGEIGGLVSLGPQWPGVLPS